MGSSLLSGPILRTIASCSAGSEHGNEKAWLGALGVIGRYIVERLLGEDDWTVVGLSRRAAPAAPRYQHIAVDRSTRAMPRPSSPSSRCDAYLLRGIPGGDGAAAGYASNIAPNRDMLVNAVSGVSAASRRSPASC
jgi:NAD(P)-dependent dehydrogenase (short-subunit alcohol dehydrogenase family)